MFLRIQENKFACLANPIILLRRSCWNHFFSFRFVSSVAMDERTPEGHRRPPEKWLCSCDGGTCPSTVHKVEQWADLSSRNCNLIKISHGIDAAWQPGPFWRLLMQLLRSDGGGTNHTESWVTGSRARGHFLGSSGGGQKFLVSEACVGAAAAQAAVRARVFIRYETLQCVCWGSCGFKLKLSHAVHNSVDSSLMTARVLSVDRNWKIDPSSVCSIYLESAC